MVQQMPQLSNVRSKLRLSWVQMLKDSAGARAISTLTSASGGAATTGHRIRTAERRAGHLAEACRAQRGRQRRQIQLGLLGAILLLAVAGYFLREQYRDQHLGVAVVEEGHGHVPVGTALTFEHYPPSSGKHYPSAQPAGVYHQEVPEGNWVHSLEHGYIAILVKCTTDCASVFDQIDSIYKGLPGSKYGNVKLVVTPYGKPYTDSDSPLMLLAWGHEQRLATVDRDPIARFYNKFVDKGREDIP